jgi:hypothetical protein
MCVCERELQCIVDTIATLTVHVPCVCLCMCVCACNQCLLLDELLARGTYLDLSKLGEKVEQQVDNFFYLGTCLLELFGCVCACFFFRGETN